MPRYHVLIESVSKLTQEVNRLALSNIDEKAVIELIANPHMNNEEFMVNGLRADPEYVESIRIVETKKLYKR
jgi:hypothetical protein